MHDFFRGWRRKVGCVTLVIALSLMGLSVRSRVVDDKIKCTIDGWNYLIHSERGVISSFAWEVAVPDDLVLSVERAEALGLPTNLSSCASSQFPEWQSEPVAEPVRAIPLVKPEKIGFMCGDPLSGFPANKFLTAEHFEFEGVRYVTNSFSIWTITMPLTLLSAYLILCKPRNRAAV